MKDELEEILSISKLTPRPFQHEKVGPHLVETYRKLGSEKSSTDGYLIVLMGYARYPFRDFENYLRIVAGSDEEVNHIFLKQNKS